LENLEKKKTIKKNDIIMFLGFGVGLSVAGYIAKWS